MRAPLAIISTVLFASLGTAAAKPVTVYLERNGSTVETADDTIALPKFGGGDRAWSQIVACVQQHYAPFDVDIVDRKPARGTYITAVVGGRASQLGLDDRTTNGVGPYSGRVQPSATVYIFSRVGTGERDAANLCAVTAHEVAHALGLDHSTKCGDIMSYWLDRCGPRKFLDAAAPCGEGEERPCGDGRDAQNSYRKLVANVGLRGGRVAPEPEPEPEPQQHGDPWGDPDDDAPADPGWTGHEPQDPYDDTADRDSIDRDSIDEDGSYDRDEDGDNVTDAYAPAPQRAQRLRRHHHRRHRDAARPIEYGCSSRGGYRVKWSR